VGNLGRPEKLHIVDTRAETSERCFAVNRGILQWLHDDPDPLASAPRR
jgi:hypothetical protein